MDDFDRLVLGVITAILTLLGAIIAAGDRVGAAVTSISPEPDGSPSVTTDIRIEFGQAMLVETVESRFVMESEIMGESRWDGNTFVFSPAEPLEVGQRYTVTLKAGAESSTNRATRKDLTWSFTPRAPGILYLSPADAFIQGLWYVDTPESEPVVIYAPEDGIFDFSPGPDGTNIAVTVFNDDQTSDIWLVNRDGSEPKRIIDCTPGLCSAPAWSPDGETIAYERREQDLTGATIVPSRVWVYDVDTGSTAPVFGDTQVLGFSPLFSQDGSRLAFYDSNVRATNPDAPGTGAIRILSLETDGQNAVIPTSAGVIGSFSADGESIVYSDIRQVGRQFPTQLLIANYGDGTGIQPLFEDAEEDQWPAWSPDGAYVAFSRRRLDRSTGFGSQLAIYDFESGSVEVLTDDPTLNSVEFEWAPTSTALIFTRIDLEGSFPAPQVWMYDLAAPEQGAGMIAENGRSARWLP